MRNSFDSEPEPDDGEGLDVPEDEEAEDRTHDAFTENPLERMMIQRPTGRRDNAPPVPQSRRVCAALYKAQSLYRLLSETGTGEEAYRAGTLKGGFFHGT